MEKDRNHEHILCECEKAKRANIASCGSTKDDPVPEFEESKVPDMFQIDYYKYVPPTMLKLNSVFYPRIPAKHSRIINGHLPNKIWHKYKQFYTEPEVKARGPDFACECWVCVPAERAY
jgi:hypothetical protein